MSVYCEVEDCGEPVLSEETVSSKWEVAGSGRSVLLVNFEVGRGGLTE